jgi:hypothetical protein
MPLMFRFVGKLFGIALGLLLISVGGSFAARAIAQGEDISPLVKLVLPDDSCPPPCWNGSNTNEDDHAATVERIMGLPHAQQTGLLQWTFSPEDETLQQVRLENGRDFVLKLQGVRLGDLLLALGKGDYQVRGYAVNGSESGQYVSWFYEDLRMLFTVFISDDGRLSPLMPVYQMSYPAGVFPKPDVRHGWVGFLQMEAYPGYPSGTFLSLD